MTTQPGQPETVAGRRLLDKLRVDYDYENLGDIENLIRRIEAAARAEAFAEIRRGVEAIPPSGMGFNPRGDYLLSRAAVTALLPSVPPLEGLPR